MKNQDIIQYLENQHPLSYAEDWDNVGLLIGNPTQDIRTVYIAIDATDKIIQDAITHKADLLITHHPLIFSGLKRITSENFITRRVIQLIQNRISLYAMHTNYDVTAMGKISEEYLQLKDGKVLEVTNQEGIYKIAVYVPKKYAAAVTTAMFTAGAGHIGNYSDCMFATAGIGSFLPLSGSQPFIGQQNQLERVEEEKIEMIVPASKLSAVLSSLIAAHPYEEPAYDIYQLMQKGRTEGIGRIGDLPSTMTVEACAGYIKEKFSLQTVKIFGSLTQEVKKVAILPGSGKSYIKTALQAGADLLITGDIGHHEGIDAVAQGLVVVDAGHYGIEHIFIRAVSEELAGQFPELKIIGETITHPFQVI